MSGYERENRNVFDSHIDYRFCRSPWLCLWTNLQCHSGSAT